MEHLEYRFYANAVASSGLIPAGAATGAITTIRDREQAHVNFLKTVIQGAGVTPVSEPTFDFTAGNGTNNGPFVGVFTNYALFLAVAQTFEDTGVRAYKGQAGNLISSNDVLTAALQIDSVEARRASRASPDAQGCSVQLPEKRSKPWMTGNFKAISPTATQAQRPIRLFYNGEDMATQAGVDIASVSSVSTNAATESFR